MSESRFLAIDPKLEDYWRAIILFGKNVACYVVEHIQKCDMQHQKTDRPYPLIEACRQFKAGAITQNELLEITMLSDHCVKTIKL